MLQNALKLLKTNALISLRTHVDLRCMDLLKTSAAHLPQLHLPRKSVVNVVSTMTTLRVNATKESAVDLFF